MKQRPAATQSPIRRHPARCRVVARLWAAGGATGEGRPQWTYLVPSRCSLHFCARDMRSSAASRRFRSEEHTSELQSRVDLVCRLLLEKKNRGIILSSLIIKYEKY